MRTDIAGRAIDLTPTEFGLLSTMAASPGRIFTRSQLLDAVRGAASRGGFSPQPPAELVDGDLVTTAELGAAQLEGGCHRGTSPANDRHLDRRNEEAHEQDQLFQKSDDNEDQSNDCSESTKSFESSTAHIFQPRN